MRFQLTLIRTNNVWHYVGSVPAPLAYRTKGGDMPTAEQLAAARQCGPGVAGLRPAHWPTRAAAIVAACRARIAQRVAMHK